MEIQTKKKFVLHRHNKRLFCAIRRNEQIFILLKNEQKSHKDVLYMLRSCHLVRT